MNAQSTNEQPLPNVQDELIVTPMNTQASPNDSPGPIDPPLITTASAMTHSEDNISEASLTHEVANPNLIVAKMPYSRREQIPKLAQDIVLYGDVHMADILAVYGVTQWEFDTIISESAAYKAAAALTKRQLDDDPHLPERMKARVMVSNLLPTLNDMANNTTAETKDRIKAVELLKEIADMGPRKQTGQEGSGMQVMINFGSTLGSALSKG